MDEHFWFKDVFGIGETIDGLIGDAAYQAVKRRMKPQYYHRDGTPILGDELMPDFMQWALYFETADRIVGNDKTLYGERLSTVFLGMDHSFDYDPAAPPILFETMLFAPRSAELKAEIRGRLHAAAEAVKTNGWDALEYEVSDEEKRTQKKYPHDQLQLRYSTEREAQDKHEELKLQCLIPPRWRRFLLYTIGGDATWE